MKSGKYTDGIFPGRDFPEGTREGIQGSPDNPRMAVKLGFVLFLKLTCYVQIHSLDKEILLTI